MLVHLEFINEAAGIIITKPNLFFLSGYVYCNPDKIFAERLQGWKAGNPVTV